VPAVRRPAYGAGQAHEYLRYLHRQAVQAKVTKYTTAKKVHNSKKTKEKKGASTETAAAPFF